MCVCVCVCVCGGGVRTAYGSNIGDMTPTHHRDILPLKEKQKGHWKLNPQLIINLHLIRTIQSVTYFIPRPN